MKRALLFLILAVGFLSAKDFSITKAELSYKIEENGVVEVEERITYSLVCREGEVFSELYLQKPPELIVSNPRGECEGASCTFRVDEPQSSASGNRELVLVLDNTKGGACGIKREKGSSATITATFRYEVMKVVKVYPDTSQFFYKVWGEEWLKPAPVKASITMPDKEGSVQFFVHNTVPTVTKKEGNAIILEATQPPKTFLEINLLMPKEWIDEKSPDIIYDPNYRKADIIRIEEESKKKIEEAERVLPIVFLIDVAIYVVLLLLPILLFAYTYERYGKEYTPEEVGYSATIEYEPPDPSTSPAEAHLFESGRIETGNAFLGTLLDLVEKKFFAIEERGEEIYLVKKEVAAEALSCLKPYEEKAKKLLEESMQGNSGAIDEISKKLAQKAKEIDEWQKSVEESIGIEKFIDLTGYNLFKSKYVLLLALVPLYAFLNIPVLFILKSMFGYAPSLQLFESVVPVLMIFSLLYFFLAGIVLSFFITEKAKMVLARWTKEGRILNLRWGNFKKYLSDYTHIKEHPPASVIIWDRMLAYAAVFGVAEKTAESMKLYLKEHPEAEERLRLEAEKNIEKGLLYRMFKKERMLSRLKVLSATLSVAHGSRSARVGRGSSIGVGGVGGHGGGFGGGGGGAR